MSDPFAQPAGRHHRAGLLGGHGFGPSRPRRRAGKLYAKLRAMMPDRIYESTNNNTYSGCCGWADFSAGVLLAPHPLRSPAPVPQGTVIIEDYQ
jgi:hypothetical protein